MCVTRIFVTVLCVCLYAVHTCVMCATSKDGCSVTASGNAVCGMLCCTCSVFK